MEIFIFCAVLIKKETPTQVFSCEFYEIFKNTFFTEHSGWKKKKKAVI